MIFHNKLFKVAARSIPVADLIAMQHCAQPMQGFRPLTGRSASTDQGIARNGIVVHLMVRSATTAYGPMNGCWKIYRKRWQLWTQLWIFLVGFPSTKRGLWSCLKFPETERPRLTGHLCDSRGGKIRVKPAGHQGELQTFNCSTVRASLPQGHLYQQELCHLPLVSSTLHVVSHNESEPARMRTIVLGCSWLLLTH